MDPYESEEYGGRPQTSGLAIASLVCAFLCWPAGLVLGIVAMVKISGSRGALGGMGLAIAGTVLSVVWPCFAMTAAVAIPGLLRSRIGANESSAVASLKAISTGEQQFRAAVAVDQDRDGVGEFGYLAELGGMTASRGGGSVYTSSPFIPAVLGTVNRIGVSSKAGYFFVVYLPGGSDSALSEGEELEASDKEAIDAQERSFVAYAWPQAQGRSGVRAFAVDAQGQVYAYLNQGGAYSGLDSMPPWHAAFEDGNGDGKLDWDDVFRGASWVPTG